MRLSRKCRSTFLAAVAAAAVAVGGWAVPSARAVILFDKPERNTDAPAGLLRDSGWQWQGDFRGFIGTPISKKYFITAGHIGGIAGNKLRLGGRAFITTAHWDDPNSDLRIYTVNKRFNGWAPLHTSGREVGKHAMIFGRGTQRGAEVFLNKALKGWEWGVEDRLQSWGINAIDAVAPGDPTEGDLLQFDFDGTGLVANEASLSTGDSAGGVFIYDKPTKQWQLAGINYSVDGPFSRTSGGTTFQAAMFDMGGVFYGSQFIDDTLADQPTKLYATRISSKMEWIMGVLRGTIPPTMVAPLPASTASTTGGQVPEPATAGVIVAGAAAWLARRRRA